MSSSWFLALVVVAAAPGTASALSAAPDGPGVLSRYDLARKDCLGTAANRNSKAAGSAYEKVDRRVGDWAVAAAGASVTLANGTIERAGIALAAVGAEVTSTEAEEALAGEPPSEELFAEAGRLAAAACSPTTDQRGSAEYKRHVAAVLTERALRGQT